MIRVPYGVPSIIGDVSSTKVPDFGTYKALVIDVETQKQYLGNNVLLGRDPNDISLIADALSTPFHIVNKGLSFYLAGFFNLGLAFLFGLTGLAVLWVLLLQESFFRHIFQPNYDFPSALSIITLIVAFTLPKILADNAATFAQPQDALLRAFNEITQLARGMAIMTKCAKPYATENAKKAEAMFDSNYDMLKALAVYTLRLYLQFEDPEELTFSGELQATEAYINFSQSEMPERIDNLTRDIMINMDALTDMGYYKARNLKKLAKHTQNISNTTLELKIARDTKIPTIFSDYTKLALIVYVTIVLPITTYACIREYTPFVYPPIVSIIFGTAVYHWWIGGPFDEHARFVGIPYFRWRANTNTRVMAEYTIVKKWFKSGPVSNNFMSFVRRYSVGELHDITAHNLVSKATTLDTSYWALVA